MVTGSITISDMDPRHFCQTFFLARQHQDNDRHNYFVRNDIFRFLDVLPEVVQVTCFFCFVVLLPGTVVPSLVFYVVAGCFVLDCALRASVLAYSVLLLAC